MNRDFKEILLELLEKDEDVVSVIKRIVTSNTQEEELLQQIAKLKKEVALVTQQKEVLQETLDKQRINLEKKENELKDKDAIIELVKTKCSVCEGEKVEAIAKYNDLKLKYAGFDFIYSKYLKLGDSIIERMIRILNRTGVVSENPEIFMAYGIQENNIVALWESVATNYEFYDSCGKTQDLVDIFEYFLGLYKEISFKNIKINCPEIEDIYDERMHTRTTSSNAVGKIQKVILPGFSIGKNLSKKALVIVK